MTASPPAAPGLPSEEEIARLLFERGRNIHDAASWEEAGDEMREWLRGHSRAILSLIRPAFEAKGAEIATFDAREEECLESMKVALENEEDAHRKLEAAEAKLAQAVEDEREACAKICDTESPNMPDREDHSAEYCDGYSDGSDAAACHFAAAIRARSASAAASGEA